MLTLTELVLHVCFRHNQYYFLAISRYTVTTNYTCGAGWWYGVKKMAPLF